MLYSKGSKLLNRLVKWKEKNGVESTDESGIRTHAPEETRSLVWRLRPLGHLAG